MLCDIWLCFTPLCSTVPFSGGGVGSRIVTLCSFRHFLTPKPPKPAWEGIVESCLQLEGILAFDARSISFQKGLGIANFFKTPCKADYLRWLKSHGMGGYAKTASIQRTLRTTLKQSIVLCSASENCLKPSIPNICLAGRMRFDTHFGLGSQQPTLELGLLFEDGV